MCGHEDDGWDAYDDALEGALVDMASWLPAPTGPAYYGDDEGDDALYDPRTEGLTAADWEELEALEEDDAEDNWWDETDLGYGG